LFIAQAKDIGVRIDHTIGDIHEVIPLIYIIHTDVAGDGRQVVTLPHIDSHGLSLFTQHLANFFEHSRAITSCHNYS